MRIFTDSDPRDGRGPHADTRAAIDRARENLSGAGALIVFASAKGGVGKSVLAVNTAVALALRGRKVAIVDADLNSPSVIAMLGMKPPLGLPMVEGIEPVAGPHGLRVVSVELIAGGEAPPISFLEDPPVTAAPADRDHEIGYSDAILRMLALTRFGAVDVVIIDVAPGIARLYQIAQVAPPGNVIVVSHPSEQSVSATRRLLKLAPQFGARVEGIVENMAGFSCDRCRSVRPLMPEGSLAQLAGQFELPILARLPFDPRLAEAADRGVAFVHQYSDTPLGKDLLNFAQEVERMMMLAPSLNA